MRGEIKKFLESNKNENTTYQNLQDTAKVMLRGKFIGISAFVRESERSQNEKTNGAPLAFRKTRTGLTQKK
jgi:hypothetical protein